MTESPKTPPRNSPRPGGAQDGPRPVVPSAPEPRSVLVPPHSPPPIPVRTPGKPASAAESSAREQTASLPGVVLPPPTAASGPGEREQARDTLAPSSFGVLGGSRAASTGVRSARAPLPTLGEIEGSSATATLRPPGAVPPPPRSLPTPTPNLATAAFERSSALDTPVPSATLGSGGTDRAPAERPLDTSGSAGKQLNPPASVEPTRSTGGDRPTPVRISAVPAPGLFIVDEPLEPRPKLPSLVREQSQQIGRMRAVMLVLGGLLLMAAGALVVMIFRRAEASANRQAPAAASATPQPLGCALLAPPSRISAIERSVPVSALALPDGNVALAVADTKTSAVGFLYDPLTGDALRRTESPAASEEVTHVTVGEPLVVDRASPDFAFAQTLAAGLALGVGPSGIVRRGADGATGLVWPIRPGVRVTPPRVATLPGAHFVTFRQGGAEGRIVAGWLRPDGSAASEATAIEGTPKSLGTPSAGLLGDRAVLLFSARAEKSEPYRVFAASATPGNPVGPARALDLPSEGGGAIAPALAALPGGRYLLQWTDGNVGEYRVQTRLLDAALAPLSAPLRVSAKGTNAGQGTLVSTRKATVSLFIQTTAGHDELWGVALSCH